MVNESYKPVRIDIKKSITKAKLRPGFTQAWNSLERSTLRLKCFLAPARLAGLTQRSWLIVWVQPRALFHVWSLLRRNEKHSPSFATLKRYANACGKKLVVQFV
jgi:hypothetical protein